MMLLIGKLRVLSGFFQALWRWLLEERVFLGAVVFVFLVSAFEVLCAALKAGNWFMAAIMLPAMFGAAHSFWTKWRHQVKG